MNYIKMGYLVSLARLRLSGGALFGGANRINLHPLDILKIWN